MLKPGLAEIFAAVTGVISEGTKLSRKGVKIDDHPLVGAAHQGASRIWDAQYAAARSRNQDNIAKPLMTFLQSSLPALDQYAALGKTAKVRDHVRDILAREASGEDRPVESFKEGGVPKKPFAAPYLGKDAFEIAPALAAAG